MAPCLILHISLTDFNRICRGNGTFYFPSQVKLIALGEILLEGFGSVTKLEWISIQRTNRCLG